MKSSAKYPLMLLSFMLAFPDFASGQNATAEALQSIQNVTSPQPLSTVSTGEGIPLSVGNPQYVPIPAEKSAKSVYEVWSEFALRKPFNGQVPGQMPLDPAFSSAKDGKKPVVINGSTGRPMSSSSGSSTSSTSSSSTSASNSTSSNSTKAPATQTSISNTTTNQGTSNISGNISIQPPLSSLIPMNPLPPQNGIVVNITPTGQPGQVVIDAQINTNGQNSGQNPVQNATLGLNILAPVGPIQLTPEQQVLIQSSTTLISPQDLTDTAPEQARILRDAENTPEAMVNVQNQEKQNTQELQNIGPSIIPTIVIPPFPGI